MLRSGFFGYLWKWYALERKFRAENAGLKNCTYKELFPPPHGLWPVCEFATSTCMCDKRFIKWRECTSKGYVHESRSNEAILILIVTESKKNLYVYGVIFRPFHTSTYNLAALCMIPIAPFDQTLHMHFAHTVQCVTVCLPQHEHWPSSSH